MGAAGRIPAAALRPAARAADDWYATTRATVEQLLEVERFAGPIWEPACGDGAICRVLQERGHEVVATDLVDRGFGEARRDFLMEWAAAAPNVVTNPPFTLATQFARHALRIVPGKVALLMKLGFLEGPTREDLHDRGRRTLARVWVLRRRVTFLKEGREHTRSNGKGGLHAFAWFVWDGDHAGPPAVGWLDGEACR